MRVFEDDDSTERRFILSSTNNRNQKSNIYTFPFETLKSSLAQLLRPIIRIIRLKIARKSLLVGMSSKNLNGIDSFSKPCWRIRNNTDCRRIARVGSIFATINDA